jgi:hypothetical protein
MTVTTNALLCLACFQPGSLIAFHKRMIGSRILYPGVLFWGAKTGVVNQLLALLNEPNVKNNRLTLNHVLTAMAWIGNEAVQSTFSQWREQSPAWASSLYIPSHAYAEVAGWELTDEGQRRNLFHEVAYPLVLPGSTASTRSEVVTGQKTRMNCPWCGRMLTTLIGCENIGKVLRDYGNSTFQALTCHVCTCFGQVFAKQASDGSATWHRSNIRPDYRPPDSSDWNAFPESPLVMSHESRHFLEAADWGVPGVSFSQVGGHPAWIQDAKYPTCPDCSQKMPFVGQLSNVDFLELAEGIYYLFGCSACGVSAASYQQS